MAEPQLLYAREPVVPISLFADAASAGINMGNAQKTTGQAIAQGITQGIQAYQTVTENQADIALKQQQLEMAPLEMEIKKQQLENEKAITEINMMKAQTEALTQKQNIELEKAKTEQELSVLRGKSKLADLQRNPDRGKEIYQDADVNAYLNSNLDLKKQVMGAELYRTLPDGTPVYSQEERDNKFGQINAEEKYRIDAAEKAKKEALNAKEALDLKKMKDAFSTGNLGSISTTYNKEISDWVNGAITAPAGTVPVKLDPATKQYYWDKTKPDHNLIQSEMDLAKAGLANKFHVFIPQPNGEYLLANAAISDTENDFVMQLKKSMGGTNSRNPLPAPGKPAISAAPPAPSQTGAVVTPFGTVYEGGTTPSPTPSPVATPQAPRPSLTPTPSDTVAPLQPKIAASSGDTITQQARRVLEEQAKSNPDLAKRLIAKGLMANSYSPTPIPTPNSAKPNPASQATREEKVSGGTGGAAGGGIDIKIDEKAIKRVKEEPLLVGKDSLKLAVAAVESKGIRNAKSPTGPVGLFQLSGDTARDLKVNRHNPEQNVAGGVAYLDKLLNKYHNQETPALMAYNGGPTLIDDAIHAMGGSNTWQDIVAGLEALLSRGRTYGGLLTKDKIEEIKNYPIKVLAYKERFDAEA